MAARKPWPEEAEIKEVIYSYVELHGSSKARDVIEYAGKCLSLTRAQKAEETPRKNGQKPLKTWSVLCHKARRALVIEGIFSSTSKVGTWELAKWSQTVKVTPEILPAPGGVLDNPGLFISDAKGVTAIDPASSTPYDRLNAILREIADSLGIQVNSITVNIDMRGVG
jgi:hypothetical protein